MVKWRNGEMLIFVNGSTDEARKSEKIWFVNGLLGPAVVVDNGPSNHFVFQFF